MKDTQVAFSQPDYRTIVGHLDDCLRFMMDRFGKSELEAQAWLLDFVKGHYIPVWRAMNPDER